MVMEARHIDNPPVAAERPWARIDIDLYEITEEGRVTGYVEVAGQVFVALAGDRYDRAVEVCQALSFAEAVAVLAPRANVD